MRVNFYKMLLARLHFIKIFYHIFLGPKKIWRGLSESEILIYDGVSVEGLSPVLGAHTHTSVAIRGEVVHVPSLLSAIFKKTFWTRGKSVNTYVAAYAKRTRPKIILSFIDNNVEFYELTDVIPDVCTIVVQNGTRDDTSDLKYLSDVGRSRKVNFMLTHNVHIGEFYTKSIKGESITVGSIRNNFAKKTQKKLENTIVFVSQFRPRPSDNIYFTTNSGETVFWDNFYYADKILFKFVATWCARNQYHLSVCGVMPKSNAELKFFSRACEPNFEFDFLPRLSEFGSYEIVDRAFITIGIDSTLCYESFARGNRTAFFHCRNEKIKIRQPFGWPAVFPESGPFWTNSRSEAEFERVMNSIAFASDEEFAKMRDPYVDDLMVWDPGNGKTKTLIDSILNADNSTQ